MSYEIEPALTAEEWRDVTPGMYRYYLSNLGDGIDVVRDARADGAEVLPLLVAIANHALPYGHRLKITREDVAMLRHTHVVDEYGDAAGTDPGLHRLAAKLAALLAPE